ncbi:MAG TPA: ABC transporter permease, partial [Chitinophagaceae bacterium]
MFKNYLKTAFRNLRKNKVYSFLNIFGLAIGIACAGLIFLWAENELNWDNSNAKKSQLYLLEVNMTLDGNNFTMGSTPRPMGKAMQAEIPGIVNTARVSDQGRRLLFSAENKSMYSTGLFADPSLFSMFSFDFVEGNAKNPLPQLYSLVLTQSAAKKFFGDEKNIVGKIIRVDNKHDYVVSNVIKDMPENSTLQFEWLAPYEITIADENTSNSDALRWDSYGPFTYVELDKNANLNAINKKLQDFIHRKSADQKTKTFLYPMSQWHLYSEFANGKPTGGGAIMQVRLLSVIAWIILLIACINFMNLATANSQKRAREIGVRKVLGAEKKKLIFQFIGEALFMSAIATVFAIIIISLSLPAFNSLMQKQLSLHLENPVHITGLLTITIICGLIAGSYPALYLSSFNPVFVLKGLKMKTGSAAFIRKGLVVFQFTIS